MLTAIGTQTIETPRLILRRFAKGDGKSAFRNWCSDASVTTYLKWSAHSYPLITEQVVARWAREYHDPHCLHWAITRKGHGDVIGGVSLTVKDLMDERAELGYSLGSAFWQQGYGSEAVQAVLDYTDSTGWDCTASKPSATVRTRRLPDCCAIWDSGRRVCTGACAALPMGSLWTA